MSDDKKNKGEPDRSRISLSEDYEVRYWTERFRCTPQELKIAVENAGNSPEAVSVALKSMVTND